MSATLQPLLIELGTDELPVKALPGLAQAFFDGVINGLETRRVAIERGNAKPLYSPRRLSVLLPGVASEQPQQASEVLGPYLNIALDADGAPTKALEGFAAKAGVAWTQLGRTTDAKGERFVHRAVKPGAATRDLLVDVVNEAIAAMPIPKPMRWGAGTHAFARPVHWLVMLLGTDIAEGEVLGISAGRESRGHRFHAPGAITLNSPAEYVQALEAAKVLVDADARRERIVAQAESAAREVGGSVRIHPDLLEEVNGLVEWPCAVRGTFDAEFLAVPHEALISTMEANQKFFAVLDETGALTPHFIGTANIQSSNAAEIRKGYERVIRPRFADARFFFEEDLKQGLEAMGEGLGTVTFQARLGTVADKVARLTALAETIAAANGVDAQRVRRAAALSKNDLQSRMVGEFPELQGIAGRHYAAHAGEAAEVANAIDEAWMPRNAADAIAPSRLGQVLAVADRLDTLAGGFAAGLKPSGNKDAFALRRTALGLARTLIEGELDIDLPALLGQASAANTAAVQRSTGGEKSARPATADDCSPATLLGFILERLRGYYETRGLSAAQFDAVAALQPRSLKDFDARLNALAAFARLPDAQALAAANKRARNILKKADGEIPARPDTTLLTEPAEVALAAAVENAIAETDAPLAARDYTAVLQRLATLRPQVDAFFDSVMVNADDARVRGNRLALLKRLADRLGSVAAIEALSG